jgi:hypothetical protein
MSDLNHCIYASAASPEFRESEIPALLDAARARNASAGITGMLLYVEGSFFQILEGSHASVQATFSRIQSDPRHLRVTQIIREPIARRHFGEWTMGFSTAALLDMGEIIGENDFFTDASCLMRLDSGRAKKLLQAFGSGRWRADKTGNVPILSRAS